MYWMITLILTFACVLINPYIGLFAIFALVQLVIYFCLDYNAKTRLALAIYNEETNNNEYANRLRMMSRKVLNIWCGLSIIMFILSTFVYITIWVVASGRFDMLPQIMTPILIFENNLDVMSVILLVLSVVLNLITVILIFCRKQQLLKLKNSKFEKSTDSMQAIEVKFKVSSVTWILWFATILAGVLDKNVGWLSLVLPMLYLLVILMTKLIISSYKKATNSRNDIIKSNAKYMLSNISCGNKYNNLLMINVWFDCAVIIAVSLLLNFVFRIQSFAILPIDLGQWPVILTCILNLILAVCLSKDVRKI